MKSKHPMLFYKPLRRFSN